MRFERELADDGLTPAAIRAALSELDEAYTPRDEPSLAEILAEFRASEPRDTIPDT